RTRGLAAQTRVSRGPPSSSMTSPGAIFRRLRYSTAPLTRTRPSAIRALASPPFITHPARFITWVRFIASPPSPTPHPSLAPRPPPASGRAPQPLGRAVAHRPPDPLFRLLDELRERGRGRVGVAGRGRALRPAPRGRPGQRIGLGREGRGCELLVRYRRRHG